MDFPLVIFEQELERPFPFNGSPIAYPLYLPRIVCELEVFEKVGSVGHASRRVIVDSNGE